MPGQYFGPPPSRDDTPSIIIVAAMIAGIAWVSVLGHSVFYDRVPDDLWFARQSDALRRHEAIERCIAARVDQLAHDPVPPDFVADCEDAKRKPGRER